MTSLPDPESMQPTTELQNMAASRKSGPEAQQASPVRGAVSTSSPETTNEPEVGKSQINWIRIRRESTNKRVNIAEEQNELMKAAQRNDVDKAQQLIESGEFSAQDCSADGTTALHWAAINNSVETVNYLLDHGAKVDQKGGELMATPLLWACRVGLANMAYLLIQKGADPLRTDAQGFNALHIAVHSSNIMLIIYLLHQGLPVDYADPQQRTPLHWAAYQGDPLSVDILLRWGADVKLKDDTGFTPLHWAVVRGNMSSMKRLIEEGSDVKAETADGKTPSIIAKEMMCYPVWLHALKKAGRDSEGMMIPKRLSQYMMRNLAFFWPWFMMWVTLEIVSYINAFVAIALSVVWLWASHTALLKIIESGNSGSVQLHKTVSIFKECICGNTIIDRHFL